MIHLFAPIGKFLDKTKLDLSQKRERYAVLEKILNISYGKMGLVFLISLFLIVSILWVWFYASHPTPGKFYQIHNDTKKVSLAHTTLTPKMSTARVESWLVESLMNIYTFNFTNVDNVLSESSIFFRDDTYNEFILSMNKKKGIVQTVKANSLEVSLTPESNVKMLKQGSYGKTRIWKMELKGLIYYSGALKTLPPPQHVVFEVLIQQVPTTQNPYGLEITQLKPSKTN